MSRLLIRIKHVFGQLLGLLVVQRLMMVDIVLHDRHLFIIDRRQLGFVLPIDRPERRSLLIRELHAVGDEAGLLRPDIGTHELKIRFGHAVPRSTHRSRYDGEEQESEARKTQRTNETRGHVHRHLSFTEWSSELGDSSHRNSTHREPSAMICTSTPPAVGYTPRGRRDVTSPSSRALGPRSRVSALVRRERSVCSWPERSMEAWDLRLDKMF